MSEKPKRILDLLVTCPDCRKSRTIPVDADAYARWRRGAKVQDAFPDMPKEDREAFITGICPTCWKAMFDIGRQCPHCGETNDKTATVCWDCEKNMDVPPTCLEALKRLALPFVKAGLPQVEGRPQVAKCEHNNMVLNEPESKTNVWKCADCGYVYGMGGAQ